MTKKASKSTLLDATDTSPGHMEEIQGGLPSNETESALAADERERPISDADFFDYCMMSFERQGKAICYYIKKNGKYLTTLKPPCDWDKLRSLFGAGHYLVQCKDELTNAFLKQKSEVLDELPVQHTETTESSHPFGFATQAPANDMTPILALMQQQNELRANLDREERVRTEAQRREDRERDEARRREERESRNDLLKTLIPAAAPFLAALLPKKDDKLDTLVEFMKDSQRESRAQNEKMLERLERSMTDKKGDLDPLAMIKLLNDAKKDGRQEMEELLDMVEERASRRAAEMGGGGDGDESTLALLIKNLGPGLSALMAQSVAKPGIAGALPEPVPGDTIEATSAPVVEAAPPKTREDIDRDEILKALLPFFADQFTRMQSNHKVDPKPAAKESLALLKAKGYSQDRVIRVFTKDILFQVLRGYNIPKEYDSWFNQYYAALVVKESEAPLRKKPDNVQPGDRTSVLPLRTDGKAKTNSTRDNAVQSSGSAGFIPAAAPAKASVEDTKVDGASEPKLSAGASPESPQQLST